MSRRVALLACVAAAGASAPDNADVAAYVRGLVSTTYKRFSTLRAVCRAGRRTLFRRWLISKHSKWLFCRAIELLSVY